MGFVLGWSLVLVWVGLDVVGLWVVDLRFGLDFVWVGVVCDFGVFCGLLVCFCLFFVGWVVWVVVFC